MSDQQTPEDELRDAYLLIAAKLGDVIAQGVADIVEAAIQQIKTVNPAELSLQQALTKQMAERRAASEKFRAESEALRRATIERHLNQSHERNQPTQAPQEVPQN